MHVISEHIGVIMGGQSSEREISLKTGQAVHAALVRLGYRVTCLDVDTSLAFRLQGHNVTLVFLALHGRGGEDGTVQGLLEMMGIPYTGSGVRASAMGMDKPVAKTLVRRHGVSIAPGVVIRRTEHSTVPEHPTTPEHPTMPDHLSLPLIVKPAHGGSTLGVSVVRQPWQWTHALKRAFEHDHEVLVESFIEGREIAVAVLDGEALPPIEILSPGGIYDYAAKYEKAETRYLCPAPLTERRRQRVQESAVRAYQVLGCVGAARVDFRLTTRGRPVFLEINTTPGMTKRSLLPMAAAQAGLDYDSLTARILQSAFQRRSSGMGRQLRTRGGQS